VGGRINTPSAKPASAGAEITNLRLEGVAFVDDKKIIPWSRYRVEPLSDVLGLAQGAV